LVLRGFLHFVQKLRHEIPGTSCRLVTCILAETGPNTTFSAMPETGALLPCLGRNEAYYGPKGQNSSFSAKAGQEHAAYSSK